MKTTYHWKLVVTVVIAIGGALLLGAYPTYPITKQIEQVTIVRTRLNHDWDGRDETPLSFRDVAVVHDTNQTERIREAASPVWTRFLGSNSGEDYPKYRLALEYADGSKEEIAFGRYEWDFASSTPKKLILVLDDLIQSAGQSKR